MEVRLGLADYAVIQIDEEDLHLLDEGYCWQVQDRSTKNRTRYYVKARRNRNGKAKPYLHRLIMNAPAGVHIDHIDGDGRNNRRRNLREANRSLNMANQIRAVGVSGFRGVHKMADGPNWSATITVNNKPIYSCGHPTAEEAARARDEMALEHFGEFAKLNFPREA